MAAYDGFLAVGSVLFALGALGFVTRRNMILIMLSAELMLHGVSLTLLAFGKMHGRLEGEAFTVFVLTVAACEAGLSLAIILSLYQKSKSLDIELWSSLKEPDVAAGRSAELAVDEEPELEFPMLPTAGSMPTIDEDAPLEPQTGPKRRKKAGSFKYGDPMPPAPTRKL